MSSLETPRRRCCSPIDSGLDQTVWSIVETCRYILSVADSYDAVVCLRVVHALEEALLLARSSHESEGMDEGTFSNSSSVSAQLALWTTLRYFYVKHGQRNKMESLRKDEKDSSNSSNSYNSVPDVIKEIGAAERRLAATIFASSSSLASSTQNYLYAALLWWIDEFLFCTGGCAKGKASVSSSILSSSSSVPFQPLRYRIVLFPSLSEDQQQQLHERRILDANQVERSLDTDHPFILWLNSQLRTCSDAAIAPIINTNSNNDVWKLTDQIASSSSSSSSLNDSLPQKTVDEERTRMKKRVNGNGTGGDEFLASPALHVLVRCAAATGADSVLAARETNREGESTGIVSSVFQLPFLRAVCALQDNPQQLEFLLQHCVIGNPTGKIPAAGEEEAKERSRWLGKHKSIYSELYYHSDLTVLTDALQNSLEVASREGAIATSEGVTRTSSEASTEKTPESSQKFGWNHVASVVRGARDVLLKDAMPLQGSQVSDVVAWFRLLRLSNDYSSALQSNAVDGEVLRSGLSVNDIVEMGITERSDALQVHRLLSSL